MNKSTLLIAIVTLLMLGLIAGCGDDDPCSTSLEGETRILSDDTKNYLNNYRNGGTIVFENTAGEEVSFSISSVTDTMGSFSYSGVCAEDTSQFQAINGTAQSQKVFLSNPVEIESPVYVSLITIPVPFEAEFRQSVVVTLEEYVSPEFLADEGNYLFEHNLNYENIFSTLQDSLVLGGKVFYSVLEISNLSPMPNVEVKYTENEGVIYMKDLSTNEEYIYLRKE